VVNRARRESVRPLHFSGIPASGGPDDHRCLWLKAVSATLPKRGPALREAALALLGPFGHRAADYRRRRHPNGCRYRSPHLSRRKHASGNLNSLRGLLIARQPEVMAMKLLIVAMAAVFALCSPAFAQSSSDGLNGSTLGKSMRGVNNGVPYPNTNLTDPTARAGGGWNQHGAATRWHHRHHNHYNHYRHHRHH
jgi:hypothetical protein